MEKYSEYKDSGIQWLGKIPSHWNRVSFKRVAFVKSNLVHPSDYLDYPQISPDCIEKNSGRLLSWKSVKESNVESDNHLFFKGQIIYSKIRPLLNKVVIAPFDGLCSADMYPIETSQNVHYLQYFMLSNIFLESVTNATRDRVKMPKINKVELGSIDIIVPPPHEQQAIVSFLDEKTEKIDTLIAEKEKQLSLLDELKQSEIASAVTRGLNPDAPLKDSGISWIGQIPEHWEVKLLRSYLRIISIKNHPEEQLLSVVREQGVIIRNTDSKEENHNFIPEDLSGYKYVQKGQFVINKMKSWQGSYGVSDYDGIVSPAYYVCDLNFPQKEFFNIAIRSKYYVPFFTQYSKGIRVGQWDLSPIGLKSIPFIEPPVEEMEAIVEYIETKLSKINTMISEIQSEIDNLKEYKQSLISDVVTGQIKVS